MPAKACRIRVTGTVQGVGFRPFVYRLAVAYRLAGHVRNLGDAGVEIVVQGPPDRIERFLEDLRAQKPPLAEIDGLQVQKLVPDPQRKAFQILPSSGEGQEGAGTVPPDVATCPACLEDTLRPTRYRGYWATSCVDCGPRFTVIEALPYDRERTAMADFPMCPACAREYADPLDRRHHAQTIACPACGPRLWLEDSQGAVLARSTAAAPEAPIAEAAKLLQSGKLVAIKGLGGMHLACDATCAEAVAELRRRRCRPGQPFALMATEAMIPEFARASEAEWALLRSPRRPIVVLEQRSDGAIRLAPSVAPGLHTVGVMLPYTGLHHLLFRCVHVPLVMTSANLPSEPMVIANEEARQRLGTIADAFLLHDRRIVARCDDSVVRRSGGGWKFLRRSRGWVPEPIAIDLGEEPLLALGPEFDGTLALYDARNRRVYPSQHIGDVANLETLRFLEEALEHLLRLTQLERPRRVVCDLHPGFLTTRLAERWAHEAPARVQHHHAHIASVMGEHGLKACVGIAVDGLGYGPDGRLWGGEVLVCDRRGFRRVGGLRTVPMPGGDLATRHPARMVAGLLYSAGLSRTELKGLLLRHVHFPGGVQEQTITLRQLETGTQVFQTSSAGRFLDAVSALLGACARRTYEGEPALRLEGLAAGARDVPELEPSFVVEEGRRVLDTPALIVKLLELKERGFPRAALAAAAQQALARGLTRLAIEAAEREGLRAIALSGGVAYNDMISGLIRQDVEHAGLVFYTNEKVPCGDGGISFGQLVAVAGAEARAR